MLKLNEDKTELTIFAQLNAAPDIPKEYSKRFCRILWWIISKAADRSSIRSATQQFLSSAMEMSW
jgi:hypothetical protein